jgi:hypothetical protein
MNIKEHVNQMDQLVSQGEIIKAGEQFFAPLLTTSDYGNLRTSSKEQTLEKLNGFLGAIAKVNGITHHQTLVDGSSSASEFTFDFDMKDGSKILWHEIIKRSWENRQVIEEVYFNAN